MNMNRLRGIMAERQCTQRALAKGIGVSESTLTNKMNGKYSFNIDEAIKICEFLHIEDPDTKATIFLTKPSQKWDEKEATT